MMHGLGRALLAIAVLIVAGCASDANDDSAPHASLDGGADAGQNGHEPADGGVAGDASDAAADGGVADAGAKNDAAADSGFTDAGPNDGAAADGGIPDAGSNNDAAAVDSGVSQELPPLAELPWQREPSSLPPCTPSGLDFATPTLEHAGSIAIEFSALLQPSGVTERARVTVLTIDGELDSGYAGTLVWSLPAGVEMVSSSAVTAGEAEVMLRLGGGAIGVSRIQASLEGDPRSGYADVLVYAPQLPIWELLVPAQDLARIVDAPESEETITATLTVDGTPLPTLVRLQGGSSRFSPKKSFRFDLLGAAQGTWGTHLILRAEYNDKTLLRNWLSMRLFRDGTWLPTPRSQLVHFRVNGKYYGVMNNVERIDGKFLTAWGLRAGASLYEADPPFALSSPGGNLTRLVDPEQYRSVYAHHGGSIDYDDLQTLIEHTLVLPNAEFEPVARREIMVDDYLVYLAMMAALQNQDNVRKNFYMYRDIQATVSSGWRILPWDLDLTLGHLWSEENDVFEEAIATDGNIFVGVRIPEFGGFFNQLTDRVLGIPAYRARFRSMLDHIVDASLARPYVERLVSNVVCRATADLVADSNKRATNAEYLDRVAELYDFIDGRAQYVRSLGALPP